WRGGRVRVSPQGENPPTPGRGRGAPFNWVGPPGVGARCLGLFVGDGGVGLEGLWRGGAQGTLVEGGGGCGAGVRARVTEWGASGGRVEHMDAIRFLGTPAQPYEIVFLDPPFASDLLPQIAVLLEDQHWLGANALIYVETAADSGLPALPATWQVTRTK